MLMLKKKQQQLHLYSLTFGCLHSTLLIHKRLHLAR